MEVESPLVQSPSGVSHDPGSAAFSPADSAFGFPHDAPTSIPSASRRRKSSTKGVTSAVIKRSMSSPNVRGLSTAAELPGSLAEKRRNKLGYHRTSVACGLCPREENFWWTRLTRAQSIVGDAKYAACWRATTTRIVVQTAFV